MSTRYEQRVNNWVDFAGIHYGIDQLHARLLASTLLPTAPGVEPTWLMVESPFHRFWDHWNTCVVGMGLPPMLSHRDLYTLRPRTMLDTYKEILDSRSLPRIMIDTEWNAPAPYPVHVRSRFPVVRSQFIRVRIPLPVVGNPPEGVQEEMFRLLSLCVDREFRTHSPKPMILNGLLETICTLLTILNPELKTDANALVRNVSMIPPALAVLHGRDAVGDTDQLTLLHVLRGAVRVWTLRILELFGEGVGSAWTVPQMVDRLGGMKRKVVWDECDRLAWEGVLDWPLPKGKWKGNRPKYVRVGSEWGEDVRGLMEGTVRWW